MSGPLTLGIDLGGTGIKFGLVDAQGRLLRTLRVSTPSKSNPEEVVDLMAEQAKLQEQLDKHDAWNLDSRLELAMDALRCPPPDMIITVLSGGERRRVALCRLLLQELCWITSRARPLRE